MTRADGGTEIWQLAPRALKARGVNVAGSAIAFGSADDTLVIVDRFGDVEVHKVATPAPGTRNRPPSACRPSWPATPARSPRWPGVRTARSPPPARTGG